MGDKKDEGGLLKSFTRKLTISSSKDRPSTTAKSDASNASARPHATTTVNTMLSAEGVIAIAKQLDLQTTLKAQNRDSLPSMIQQSLAKMKEAEKIYLMSSGNVNAKKEALAAYETSAKLLESQVKKYLELANDAQLERVSPMGPGKKQAYDSMIEIVNKQIVDSKNTVTAFTLTIQQASQKQSPPTLETMRSNISQQLNAVRNAWTEYDKEARGGNSEKAQSKYQQYETALQTLQESFNRYQNEAPRLLEQAPQETKNKDEKAHADFISQTAASIVNISPEKWREKLRGNINLEVSIANHSITAIENAKPGVPIGQHISKVSEAQKHIGNYELKLDTLVDLSAANHPMSAEEEGHYNAVKTNIEKTNRVAQEAISAKATSTQQISPPKQQ